MSNNDFHHLILLIGTNPLPNFVVADYFLKCNKNIEKIWLIHSEKNNLQEGTDKQAERLRDLLKKQFDKKIDFEFVCLSDVSHAKTIRRDTENMIGKLENDKIHLNYTGGTKAMSTHVYWLVKDKLKDNASFSYLDARQFRLMDDKDEMIVEDLRKEVAITFDELFDLHGFDQRKEKKDKKQNSEQKLQKFKEGIENGKTEKGLEGWVLEDYLYEILDRDIKKKLNGHQTVLQNQLIKKSGWKKEFESDVLVLHGYHLTGISCTFQEQKEAKLKGFEIIHRIKQIGGDEAKSVLITILKSRDTKNLQDELIYDTGGDKNILVLGIDDLKKERLVSEIEEFIFEKE